MSENSLSASRGAKKEEKIDLDSIEDWTSREGDNDKRAKAYLPSDVQLVVPHKVALVALEAIQDQCFVCLGNPLIRKPPLVGQIHFSGHRPAIQAWCLGIKLQINGFGWLNTENKFVAGNIFEDTLCNVLELHADFDLCLVEGYKEWS